MKMQHDTDPAKQILKEIGDISKFEVMHNDVLIAVYLRPEKKQIEGSDKVIYLPDGTRQEDQYQGKAGVVLSKGPLAFVSDENYDFKGQDVKPGDWVAIWVSDGRKIIINGVLCRMVEDRHIRLKIPAPDAVY
jgi:hypothetical protein